MLCCGDFYTHAEPSRDLLHPHTPIKLFTRPHHSPLHGRKHQSTSHFFSLRPGGEPRVDGRGNGQKIFTSNVECGLWWKACTHVNATWEAERQENRDVTGVRRSKEAEIQGSLKKRNLKGLQSGLRTDCNDDGDDSDNGNDCDDKGGSSLGAWL